MGGCSASVIPAGKTVTWSATIPRSCYSVDSAVESDESWMWDPEVEWSSCRSSQVDDFASVGSESEPRASVGSESELEFGVSNRYSDNLLSPQVEQVPDLETVISTVTSVVIPRDSFALKQEAFQLKVQELRRQREELFQAQEQQRDALHNDVLRVAKEKQEYRAYKHAEYKRTLASQKHLTARQKEIERREREESLAEYRKQFEGIRGFSHNAGRVRNLQTVNPTIRRNKYNTLAPRRRTRQRGSLSRI